MPAVGAVDAAKNVFKCSAAKATDTGFRRSTEQAWFASMRGTPAFSGCRTAREGAEGAVHAYTQGGRGSIHQAQRMK